MEVTPTLSLRQFYENCKRQGEEIRADYGPPAPPGTAVSVQAAHCRQQLYGRGAPVLVFYDDASAPEGFAYLRVDEQLSNVVEGPWMATELVFGCHVLNREEAERVVRLCHPDYHEPPNG